MKVIIAHSADTDDAFYYHALREGLVGDEELAFSFHLGHIQELNELAERGIFDVTAISSVSYALPSVHSRYRILDAGTSVGRGYGPVLAARRPMRVEELDGRRVGVAGARTTGGVLMARANPRAELVPCDYTEMAEAVHRGELDAAVLIHEELLAVKERGLVEVLDLGRWWCEREGMPLPVGLNLIHRRLSDETGARVARAIRASIQYALDHGEEVLRAVSPLSRGQTVPFVEMFANRDSLEMAADVRRALPVLLSQVADLGLGDPGVAAAPLPIVEASLAAA